MLYGEIHHQHLTLLNTHAVADTIDYLEMRFSFTEDWAGVEKWAHFSSGDTVYDILLTDDEIRKEDHLNLGKGKWEVYLHGNRFADGQVIERITTDEARLFVYPTGGLNGQPLPDIPASQEELLRAEMAKLRGDAGALAEAAAASAERAENAAGAAQGAETSSKESASESAKSAAEAADARVSAIGAASNAETSANNAAQSAEAAEKAAPKIGENGNWYIGGVDTGNPSRGDPGEPGAKGEKGDKGDKGDPGEPSATGAAPDAVISIDEHSGEAIYLSGSYADIFAEIYGGRNPLIEVILHIDGTIIGGVTAESAYLMSEDIIVISGVFTGADGSEIAQLLIVVYALESGDLIVNSLQLQTEQYELPVANSNTLGGVMPVAKTSSMENPVGVSSDGKLYVNAYNKEQIAMLRPLIKTITNDGTSAASKYRFVDATGNEHGEIVASANAGRTVYIDVDVPNAAITSSHEGLRLTLVRIRESGQLVFLAHSGSNVFHFTLDADDNTETGEFYVYDDGYLKSSYRESTLAHPTSTLYFPSSKAVADYVAEEVPKLGGMTAEVGQFARVKAVDANGVPTEWEAGAAGGEQIAVILVDGETLEASYISGSFESIGAKLDELNPLNVVVAVNFADTAYFIESPAISIVPVGDSVAMLMSGVVSISEESGIMTVQNVTVLATQDGGLVPQIQPLSAEASTAEPDAVISLTSGTDTGIFRSGSYESLTAVLASGRKPKVQLVLTEGDMDLGYLDSPSLIYYPPDIDMDGMQGTIHLTTVMGMWLGEASFDDVLYVMIDTEGGIRWNSKSSIGGGGGSYTLPVATSTTLGGVKVAPKTTAMTQAVGADSGGNLDVDAYTKAETDEMVGAATPSIGSNGNWYIGGADTGNPSRGEDGKNAYEVYVANGGTLTEAEWAELYIPDESLTQSGKAADAKVVGDRLAGLTEEIVEQVTDAVKQEVPLVKSAEQPEFANSVEEMTDPEKIYVMPDGYMYISQTTENYNLLKLSEVSYQSKLTENGVAASNNYNLVTGWIPVKYGKNYTLSILYNGNRITGDSTYFTALIMRAQLRLDDGTVVFYDSGFQNMSQILYQPITNVTVVIPNEYQNAEAIRFQMNMGSNNVSTQTNFEVFEAMFVEGDSVEDATNKSTTYPYVSGDAESVAEWWNTGLQYNLPSNYEDRINELESDVAKLKTAAENPASASPYFRDVNFGIPPSNYYRGLDDNYSSEGFRRNTEGTTYTSYDAYIQTWRTLVSNHSAYVTETALGNASDGQTVYLYDFKPVRMIDSNEHQDKPFPKIIIFAVEHGGEMTSSYGLYYFIKNLLNKWNQHPALEYLRHHVELMVIPVLNPYGWDNASYKNANGVNINRNFDSPSAPWKSISDTTSNEYGGESAFDQPETQMLCDLLVNNDDALMVIDFHVNGGGVVDAYNKINYYGFIKREDSYFNRLIDAAQHQLSAISANFNLDYELGQPDTLLGFLSHEMRTASFRNYGAEEKFITVVIEGFGGFPGDPFEFQPHTYKANEEILVNWLIAAMNYLKV